MRNHFACPAMLAFAGIWFAVSVGAQTKEGRVHTRVSVNAGLQVVSTTFAGVTSQQVRLQPALVNSTYRVGGGQAFDGGVAVTMRNSFGVGLTGSWHSKTTNATANATIPHPFFYESPRTIAGAPTGLTRGELAVHVQALYVVRPTERLDLVVSGGPSFFSVKQTFVSEVSFVEAYPYDSATFAGAALKQVTNQQTGFNVGADIGLRLGRSVGVGGLVRFSHAGVSFAVPNGNTRVDLDAGGLQVGGGFRLYF